ncbi:hypothetical protein C0995_001304 [Termitomyces sp. Mi166|nr:hypothetical protein C0995_001304 [Termitomyces sp. Mi166\
MEGTHVGFMLQGTYYPYIVCKMPEKTSTAIDISVGFTVSITFTVIITAMLLRMESLFSAGHRWRKPLVAFILTASLSQLGVGMSEASFH